MSVSVIHIIIFILFALDLIFISTLVASKLLRKRNSKRNDNAKRVIMDIITGKEMEHGPEDAGIDPKTMFSIYREILVSIEPGVDSVQRFLLYFESSGLIDEICRSLKSRNRDKRSEAAINLAYLPVEKSRRALESALAAERFYHVRLFIVNSLVETGDEEAIPYILQTLIGAPHWYKEKIYAVIGQFGEKLHAFLVNIKGIESRDIKLVLISFARFYYSTDLKNILEKLISSDDTDIAGASSEPCLKYYPELLRDEKYLKSDVVQIRRNAAKAFADSALPGTVPILARALADGEIRNDLVDHISGLISGSNDFFKEAVTIFLQESDSAVKDGLAEALSNRVDYLFAKLRMDISGDTDMVISEILKSGYVLNAANFLNENSDEKLEDRLCEILIKSIPEMKGGTEGLSRYLNDRLLMKLELDRPEPLSKTPRLEKVKTGYLKLFLVISFLPAVLALALSIYHVQSGPSPHEIFSLFLYIFNVCFAIYAVSLNSIYLSLLLFSFYGSHVQRRRWMMNDRKLLFKEGVLPSISIIAPAYGEAATIVESVNSLMNIDYPDYEVIVVNDGSTDNTLENLIENFSLERREIHITHKLETSAVRGVYRNRYIPNLTVVDKVNGGKADSLNAGINLAGKEFFCGIDADSLLERDALLKLASSFLHSDRDVIAAGGNIFPVNGCEVDRGNIDKVSVSGNFLPSIQSMEYIRSFMAGRIGWAVIRGLLIISGAFGLFRKSMVIESGGYLTSREKFHKDTVGEDMELVVRLIRYSRESGVGGDVCYIFNASCWTEVPEDFATFRRQRDRWQRGLLDIITYHIRMLLNPGYGASGILAFPYFLIFEILGPWFEIQGLVIFAAALLSGVLDQGIILLIFTGSVFMGVTVSVVSLLIMERGEGQFNAGDIGRLLFYAVFENFGVRQFLNILRIDGFINALKRKEGWGDMKRKGFDLTVREIVK